MADRSALSWLQDRTAVRAHMKSHQIDRQLKAGGGFARVTGFLPPAVAAEAHRLLTEHSSWECMHDGEVNDRADSIAHSFQFAEPEDHPQTLGVLVRDTMIPQEIPKIPQDIPRNPQPPHPRSLPAGM